MENIPLKPVILKSLTINRVLYFILQAKVLKNFKPFYFLVLIEVAPQKI